MKILVTGATGFIGGNLVRALNNRGYHVRAMVRPKSDTSALDSMKVERVFGDLTDQPSITRAVTGCDALFHCGALYSFWNPRPQEMYRTNVDGTKMILEEALKAGVNKVVYTSTVSTIGMPEYGLGTEDMEAITQDMVGHYKRSKLLAEREALDMNQKGLPVVVVNPTAPVGPWDIKPTPTGAIILDFLRKKIPAYINTGMNLVDVEDVALGHILALEKGEAGERYILGNRNMTLKEIFDSLADITGTTSPRIKLPLDLVVGLAYIDWLIEGKLFRKTPILPLEGIRVARKPMYVNCQKSIEKLGFPQNPVDNALQKAVAWFFDKKRV
ncbi:NAD-dependent epimerase/dehydratase family protein [SAR202 cluster bacterium AD-804-J14_MRT_500m]|nr:NAD-dependent epimerase/dehydratase family protein [SAR202 cluster bacterium AD-804-J14_MRT_500m]